MEHLVRPDMKLHEAEHVRSGAPVTFHRSTEITHRRQLVDDIIRQCLKDQLQICLHQIFSSIVCISDRPTSVIVWGGVAHVCAAGR